MRHAGVEDASAHLACSGAMALHARLSATAMGLHARLSATAMAAPEFAPFELTPAQLMLGMVPSLPPVDAVPGTGGGRLHGPIDEAYARWVDRNRQVVRLHELNAPRILLANEQRMNQAAFERLLLACAGTQVDERQPAPEDGFVIERSREPVLGWETELAVKDTPEHVRAALLLAGDTLVVQGRFATACVPPRDRCSTFATAGLELVAADRTGRFVLFKDATTVAHLVWDRTREAFVRPPRAFPFGWMWEDHEMAFVVDARANLARRAHQVVDYPAFYATSPDTRWLWIEDKEGNGGIYSTHTGRLEWPRPLKRFASKRGARADLGKHAQRGSRRGRAFALGPDRKWRLYAFAVFYAGVEPAFQLSVPSTAVAFDPTGERLALLHGETAVIIDVRSTPKIVRIVDLARTSAALSWRSLGVARRETLVRLGYRYGTPAIAARAQEAELLQAGVAAGGHCPNKAAQ